MIYWYTIFMGLCWILETPSHFAPALHGVFTKAMESLTRKLCKEGSCTWNQHQLQLQLMFHKTPPHPGVCVSTQGASILHRYGCTHTMAQQHWVRGKSNFRRNPAQELQSFVVPLCGEAWVVCMTTMFQRHSTMDDGDTKNAMMKLRIMTTMTKEMDYKQNHE